MSSQSYNINEATASNTDYCTVDELDKEKKIL